MSDKFYVGVCKWFGYSNYGFIKVKETNEDVFVHGNDVTGFILKEGDYVKFNIDESNPKGKSAKNVAKIPEEIE